MPINVFVSCDSKRKFFSDCVKRVCQSPPDDFDCHYIPDEVAPSDEQNRLDRMLTLMRNSDIVLMDATPMVLQHNGQDVYITNSGVLIEYGVLLSSPPYRQKVKVFCESTVSRTKLHPYFLQTVHSYSLDKINDENDKDSLRMQVKALLIDYKKHLPELNRRMQEQIEAYRALTKI